jgi:two-component system, OmpR family, KDP operon response regulator KdpE
MTRRINILVVDDELPFRKVVQTSLSARGFSVEQASDAEQALEMLQQHPFEMVLLDINMPGMGGIEACRRIRAVLPNIGIVMATVRESERDMVQALEAGADDYVTKPLRFGELVARLRAVLRRIGSPDMAATVIQAGDLEIDLERRILRRAGEIVHLTPTEFDLLALLMKNRGMPLTHAKLLRTIWGPEYGEELEYLRSYVKTLRKKIEDDPAQPKYILTEPWVGYRFQSPSDEDPYPPTGSSEAVPTER